MARWWLSWRLLDGVYGSTVYSNCTNIWSWYYYYTPNISWIAVWARHSRCLTSINVLIVSGCRLTWRNNIVSHPPEKICSIATADPFGKIYKWLNQHTNRNSPGILKISRAWCDKPGNCALQPAHHWIGSQFSKSSCGNFQNSSSSSTSMQDCCLYRAVKFTFWGEPEDSCGAVGCGKVAHTWGIYCSW